MNTPYDNEPSSTNTPPTQPTASMPPAHQEKPQQTAPVTPSPQYGVPAAKPIAPAHAQKAGSSNAKTFFISFLGAALAVVIGLVGFGIFQSSSSGTSSEHSTTVLGSSGSDIQIEEDDTLAEAVSKKALPSVVNIDVYVEQTSMNPFGYGSSSGESTQSSLGSGVVLSEDGYIITNYHVIEGADSLEVTVGDETHQASIVGTDPSSDLAVLKIDGAEGLVPIEIGSSADLEIGEWVMTIGSPFGLEQSVATGIVSATSRSQIVESTMGDAMVYTNLIQTDAAINPGNSGGALVDSDGKLIGVNTLITSYSGNYSGVGFAIPVDYAISIAEQIISGEEPTHAQLGVSLSTVSPSVAQRYGLATDSGAYVTQVYSDSGADKAGVEVGDIITKFEGTTVTSASDLMLEIRSHNPGDKVSMEINRSGKIETLEVTLGSDAATSQSAFKQAS
ncbi:MAG: trypsin-like peptidase domain-containing protein [Raoultibacter sp.]|jgi:S1-C subfamily serine protease